MSERERAQEGRGREGRDRKEGERERSERKVEREAHPLYTIVQHLTRTLSNYTPIVVGFRYSVGFQ